jgi:hypothetical protein
MLQVIQYFWHMIYCFSVVFQCYQDALLKHESDYAKFSSVKNFQSTALQMNMIWIPVFIKNVNKKVSVDEAQWL